MRLIVTRTALEKTKRIAKHAARWIPMLMFGWLMLFANPAKIYSAIDLKFHSTFLRSARPYLVAVVDAAPLPQAGGPVGNPNGTGHSVTLNWTASTSTGTSGYYLYRSTATGGESGAAPLNGTTVITGLTYTDTGVAAGTKYFYVVVATDAAGDLSPFSPEASTTVPAGNVLNPPAAAPTVVAK